MRIKPWGIGLFIVLGVALFTTVLFMIGNRQEAFGRHLELYTEFSNLSGLATGAKVRVSGFDAGELKKIQIPGKSVGKVQAAAADRKAIRRDGSRRFGGLD